MDIRKIIYSLLILCASLISAEVNVNVDINIGPRIRLPESPGVVLVSPGIMVIEDYPDEVFFVSGFYWTLHGGHWYKCGGHKGRWIKTNRGKVPSAVLKMPPGKYKHWRAAKGHESNTGKSGKGHGKRK